MSEHYLLAGSGLEFLAYQETGVVQHPQPVSPSGVVDINHRIKHEETFGELESSSLPKPEHQGCIGKGYPQRMFGDPQPAMDMLLGTKQVYLPQRALGGTSPEDKQTDLHSPPPLTAHQTKALPQREMEATFMIHRPNPMLHPRTESFGLEEREENEEINIAIGVGKKESPKTTAAPPALKSVMAPSDEELLAKFKKKKEKNNSCTLKEFRPGVLLPRSTSARSPLLVTQPLQDPEAKFPEYSLVPRNDQGFETKLREAYEDCHGHLSLSRCTRRVTEQEFLTATEHLPETNQDGLWIVDHGLHPNGGAYCEDVHFTAQRVAKGGFGTVSRCRDKASEKPFIQKKMLKEKWRKAENIALMMLKEHPNICQIQGMKQERDGDRITVSLFLEDAGVSLSQLVRMTCPGKLSPQQIWNIAEQMFSGLVALHRHEILHLDLKPDNICIQVNRGNFILKIVDLGSAKLSQEPFSFCGMTPEYLSPEICTCFIAHQPGVKNLAEKLISGKADVAAGALIIMYMIEGYDVLIRFITNGQTSYTGKTEAEIKTLRTLLVVIHACNPDLASHLISEGIDMNLRELLNGCLVGDPEKRFTSKQALQFIWEKKDGTKEPQLIFLSMAALQQLEAKVGSQDKLVVTPINRHSLLCHQNQQGRGGVHTCQQTTQAGERVFGLNSQQDPRGANNFPLRVSSRNKHRDKTEPYPTHRRSSCSVSEDLYTNGATQHPNATGVIPTTVNPEAYPAAPDRHGGNLPNFDILK